MRQRNDSAAWLVVASLFATPVLAQDYTVEDAERFSTLFLEAGGAPTAEALRKEYLEPGTAGVEIFTPYRIVDAENLAGAIVANAAAYRKGIDVCLPAARQLTSEASRVLEEIRRLLGQDRSAPAFVLFGANNSGGTADEHGLALGLEVICRFADTPAEAADAIRSFVAHEIVHVYQARNAPPNPPEKSLLRQALHEGFADWVSHLVTGNVAASEKERHEFGLTHEARLWTEFRESLAATTFQPWMYGPGEPGRPPDLGYWIGKRIAEAYYSQADDKAKALQDLLRLEDPHEILRRSGYAPK